VLSCDAAKLQKSSQQRRDSLSDSEDFPTKVSREPIKCPFPECDVVHLRTALMKRHLCEAHNIQVSVLQNLIFRRKGSSKTHPISEADLAFRIIYLIPNALDY
jgi:hypothetical protein